MDKYFATEEDEIDYYLNVIRKMTDAGVTIVLPTKDGIIEFKKNERQTER